MQAEALRGAMFRVSRAYLRQECDRADVVQEALFKAWRKLPALREEAYFKTWLIRILIRECVNLLRRQAREAPYDTLPDVPAPVHEGDSQLREAILSLPSALRVTVVLYYMEGMSTREIAQTLRLPHGTVCARLKRAREKLKALIGEDSL